MQNLNYDPQGFIIGLQRVERQTSLLHDDTQTIIRILSSQSRINETQLQGINQRLQQLNQTTRTRSHQRNQQTRLVGEQISRQSNRHLPAQAREIGNTTNTPVRQASQNRQNTPNSTERLRDSNGRFTSNAEEVNFIQRLSDTVAKNVAEVGVDDRNLDPLVESMHEVYDTVKPMGKMFGLMWRMGAWTKNKLFAQKRNEPLSQAQEQHNRTVEEHLENIADNGRRGGLLGLLAKMLMGGLGLLMAGGKGALKLLKKTGGKGLGILGALFGVSNLAHGWDNLTHGEKSSGVGAVGGGVAGAIAGASIGSLVLPGVGTVVGGLLGGWLGSEGGEALGKTASPYIERWTNGLKNYNLVDKMKQVFTLGLSPFFSGASAIFDWVKTKAKDLFNIDLPTPNNTNSSQLPTPDSPIVGGNGGVKSSLINPSSNHDLTASMQKHTEFDAIMKEEYSKLGFTDAEQTILKAQIAAESQFNPNAKSHVGAKGLAQFMPATAKQYGVNTSDPRSSIRGQGQYMKDLLKHSGGDWAKALAFYNAGQGSTSAEQRYQKVMGFKETNAYVNKILSASKKMGVNLGGQTTPQQTDSTQSNKLQQLASQSGRFGNNRVVIGDSIGVQYNQLHSSDKSTAVNGQNPTQVLGQIQSLIKAGTIQKGTEVVLSSGLSNAMDNKKSIDVVKQQLQTLQKTGANVRLLGVADNFNNNTKLGSLANQALQTYAKAYGATFEGGFSYNPSDKYKAHPANSYFNDKGWKSTNIAQTKTPNTAKVTIPKPPTITQKLSTDKSDTLTVSSQNQIPQNISDKSLAYAITGGLGGERFLG